MKRNGIKFKLGVLTGVLILGLTVVGFVGIKTSRAMSSHLQTLIDNSIPTIRRLTLIDMVHDSIRSAALEALVGLAQKEPSHTQNAEAALAENEKSVNEHFRVLDDLSESPELKAKLAAVETQMAEYLSAAKDVVNAAGRGDQALCDKTFDAFQAKYDSLEKALEELGEFAQRENQDFFAQVSSAASSAQLFSIAIFLIALGCGVAMGISITRMLVKALDGVSKQLSSGAAEVGAAVSQLSSASHSLSATASQQASALQQTAASIEQISAMVKRSAENAGESRGASDMSRDRAERGREVVAQMVDSMREISISNETIVTEIDESNRRFSEIASVIREIGEKTKVINDIVFQTKLLSFNASVEATRAGAHGKGFAVVAEEVGKLAASSGSAANEIGVLLNESIKKVEDTVKETQEKVSQLVAEANSTVSRGVQVASECGDVLQEIVTHATQVSHMVEGIATASGEQSRGVSEILKATHMLEETTHVSTGAASSCAAASEELSAQVESLQEASSCLRLIVDGATSLSRFEWKDLYCLDIDELDAEHRELIKRINALAAALERGSLFGSRRAALSAIQNLASYAQKHFADEEDYMRSIGFPGLTAHADDHRKLLARVMEHGSQIRNGTVDATELMDFLTGWLLKHILGSDMTFAKFEGQAKVAA